MQCSIGFSELTGYRVEEIVGRTRGSSTQAYFGHRTGVVWLVHRQQVTHEQSQPHDSLPEPSDCAVTAVVVRCLVRLASENVHQNAFLV